jgi:hypothetical protein
MLEQQSASALAQAPPVSSPGLHLFPTVALANLDPILHEIGQMHTQPTQFLISEVDERQGLTTAESVDIMQCQTVVQNTGTTTLAVLSGEDATSVLSQGLKP